MINTGKESGKAMCTSTFKDAKNLAIKVVAIATPINSQKLIF
ncbi:MAG TPA: hypothetical protein VK203_19680 [Nostocaceae cyanobacterium]|nr:hypothetical protein [Nostocaceae cyanobacterium]